MPRTYQLLALALQLGQQSASRHSRPPEFRLRSGTTRPLFL